MNLLRQTLKVILKVLTRYANFGRKPMPRKKPNSDKDNKDNNKNIEQIKKKIDDVANDYKKYLQQMGHTTNKDEIITKKFMDEFDKVKNKENVVKNKEGDDRYVYEVPLVDFDGPFQSIMDTLPNDEIKDKLFDIIENHGLRINVNNGTIELLIYD